MTRPRRVRTATKTTAPPAVQAILDQLAAGVDAPAVSPFGDTSTGVVSPFGEVSPFGAATASTAFAAAGQGSSAFAGSTAFQGSTVFRVGSDAFRHRFKSKARFPKRRRILVPPPIPATPPEFGGYWMPMCELLRCYEDTWDYRDKMWTRGEGWNFTVAFEQQGERCAEDSCYRDPEPDHIPDEETNRCMSGEHYLSPLEAKTLEDTLRVCSCDDYDEFGWYGEFSDIWPYMVEIRNMALADPERYVNVPRWPESIYKWAGYDSSDLYDVMKAHGSLTKPIIEAVEAGDHKNGLAAAYADQLARHFPLAFGAVGKEVDEGLRYIHTEGWLRESPLAHLVFERLREPIDWFVNDYSGRRWANLEGKYGVTRITYHSALARGKVHESEGWVGWRHLWVKPVQQWRELYPDDVIVIGGDDDDVVYDDDEEEFDDDDDKNNGESESTLGVYFKDGLPGAMKG